MFAALRLVFANAAIRVATLTLFCVGFTFASCVPYVSLIAVRQLGFTERQYAILLVAEAVASMIGGVVLGHFSDVARNRKLGIMIALGLGFLGFAGFALFPSPLSFVFCLLLIVPISSSAYSQLFAVIRAKANELGGYQAKSINSVVRSIYAASWIIVPGLVGLFIATRTNVSDSFAVAALAFAFCFVLYGLLGTASAGVPLAHGLPVWQGLREAVGLVTSRRILFRVVALAMIANVLASNSALLPLFITHLPGAGLADVGIIAGLVAALEIPFMLVGGYLNQRTSTWKIIVVAGLAHSMYLAGLGLVSALWQIYALAVLNASGAAIVLSLHLNYVQDLIPERPGLGTSLLSIGGLLTRIVGALVFAFAGTAFGFSGAALLGAGLSFVGCLALILLDYRRPAITL